MSRRLVVAVALASLCPGCLYVIPRTKTREVRRVERRDPPVRAEGRVVLAARADGHRVRVVARWRGQCEIGRRLEVERRREKRARFWVWTWSCGSGDDCALAWTIGILFSPATLFISGATTSVILMADDPVTTTEVEPLEPLVQPCDQPAAGVSLRADLGGHAPLRARTGADGRADLELPATASGTVRIVAAGAPETRPIEVALPGP